MSAIEDGAMQERPKDSNADAWHLFLSEWLDARALFPNGLTFMAVQIAEAIDAALESQSAELTRLREQSTTDLTVIQSLNREAHALRERHSLTKRLK